MQKVILKTFFFALLLIVCQTVLAESAQLKFESKAKVRNDKTVAPEEQILATQNRHKEDKAAVLTDRFTEATSEEGVRDLLSKYEIILSREKRPEKIIPIEFNRVICYIDLARAIRVRVGGKTVGADEKFYLQKSMELIEKLLKIKNLKKPLVSQLYFFQGVSYLDLEEKEKSRKSLELAIDIFPKSRFVPSLSLYLADIDYDAGKLELAEKLYRKFYEDMKPDEKNYSDYKVAWIKLNQSKIDEAVNLFLKIIRNSKSKSIIQDSILSVSLALSEKYSESYILDIVDKYQIPDNLKLRIFWSIYDIFLKNPLKEKFEIWDRILKYERDQEALIRLMSAGLNSMSLKDQIAKEVILIEKINKYILSKKSSFARMQSTSKDYLGEDFEVVMVKALGVYQKNKDRIAYKILRISIESYLALEISARKLDVISLYLELLIDDKDDMELMKLCQKILLSRDLQPLRNRAKLLVLLNFEKKYLGSPDSNQSKFFKLIDSYLNQKDADQWQIVAEKYFNYLIKANLSDEAERLALKIFNRDNSERNFTRLISVKYESKKCPEVIELIQKNNFQGKDVLEYKRECHLLLADESKQLRKNSEQYKKNIVEFIGLSDGKKKNAAIADYLINLEVEFLESGAGSDKQRDEYELAFQKTFFSYRFLPEIFPIYQREIRRLLENGKFDLALIYLQDCRKFESCSSMKDVLVQLESVKALDEQGLQNIKNDNLVKSNLSYISLINPEFLVDSYIQAKTKKNSLEKSLLTVVSRLSELDWLDPKFKKLYDFIQDNLSGDERVYIYSNSWQKLLKTKVPVIEKRHWMSDQDVMYLITKVQNARKALVSELSSLSLVNQKFILGFAESVEMNMANVIKFSPIPKNLDRSKIPEYQAGLDQLAEEFTKQSLSFKEMKLLVETKIKEREAIEATQQNVGLLEKIDLWDWGSTTLYHEPLFRMLSAQQFYRAIFYLDFLYSNGKLIKEEYFQKRLGLFLYSANLRKKQKSMQNYLLNELQAEKLDIVIENWTKGKFKK